MADHCLDNYFRHMPSLWNTAGVWDDAAMGILDIWAIWVDLEVQAACVTRALDGEGVGRVFELSVLGARTAPRIDGRTIRVASYTKAGVEFFRHIAIGAKCDVLRSLVRPGLAREFRKHGSFRTVAHVLEESLNVEIQNQIVQHADR